MAKVFVTGATGFIGKELVAHLVKNGHTVLALVRSMDKWNQFLSILSSVEQANCMAVVGDLRSERLGLSQDDYQRVLGSNVIIHAGVPMDITLEESLAREVILQGANRLLKVAKEIHEQNNLQKLIHIVGYMSQFGDESGKLTTDVFELSSGSHSAGGYEKYKFLADLLFRQEAYRTGLPLIVVNPSTVVGPRHTGSTEQTDGLGLVVSSMRRGKFPVLPWGKEWWLPLLAVDDLAHLLVGIVESNDSKHQTYYALHGRDFIPSFPELIQLMAKELRMKSPKTRVPLSLLKKILHWGGGKLMGVPANSMDFIVKKEYPLLPSLQILGKKGVGAYDAATFLPRVVADLDYRLSSGNSSVPCQFQRERIGDLAAYKKEGKGDTYVFLHGLFSDMSDLIPLAEHLTEETVWLIDLPGFGRSSYHHQEDVIQGYIDSVVKAIQEIPSNIHLVGHSFGGYLANEVAKRVPDRIEKLYLLQPPLHAPDYPFYLRQLGKYPLLFEKILQKFFTPGSLETAFLEQGVFQSKKEIPLHYLEKVQNLLQSPRIRKTHAELFAFFTKSFTGMEWSRQSSFPTKVIWGSGDKVYQISREVEDLLIHLHIEVERVDLGHHFPISHPKQTANALKAHSNSIHHSRKQLTNKQISI